jgi:uncharacterized protein YdeI (YjbR/CyaY-like superfamily)
LWRDDGPPAGASWAAIVTQTIHVKDRKAWRAWLKKHHLKEREVKLLKYKVHTGKPALSHRESMEEAICWGWIDTTIKRVDDDTYTRTFRRRTHAARWSNATLGYARAMIAQGLMQPEGLKRYQEALKKPVLDHGLPKNPQTPEALKKRLAKSKKATAFWEALAPSYRRYAIYMVEKSKRPETKRKWITKIYENCRDEKRPLT